MAVVIVAIGRERSAYRRNQYFNDTENFKIKRKFYNKTLGYRAQVHGLLISIRNCKHLDCYRKLISLLDDNTFADEIVLTYKRQLIVK